MPQVGNGRRRYKENRKLEHISASAQRKRRFLPSGGLIPPTATNHATTVAGFGAAWHIAAAGVLPTP